MGSIHRLLLCQVFIALLFALPAPGQAADEKLDLVAFGGTLPSRGAVETHYAGNRALLLDELVAAVKKHYREKVGENPENYRAYAGDRMITFEPRLAEDILEPKVVADDPRIPAGQYFGTKGFFASYDAKLDEPLNEAVKAAWEKGFAELQKGTLEPMQFAKAVYNAEAHKSPATAEKRGARLLSLWNTLNSK